MVSKFATATRYNKCSVRPPEKIWHAFSLLPRASAPNFSGYFHLFLTFRRNYEIIYKLVLLKAFAEERVAIITNKLEYFFRFFIQFIDLSKTYIQI
jgi:hypothetical protein